MKIAFVLVCIKNTLINFMKNTKYIYLKFKILINEKI
jgi:hypothetical protein